MTDPRTHEMLAQIVEQFNRDNPIGSTVRYWSSEDWSIEDWPIEDWPRRRAGTLSRTRTAAILLGGHTAVVWVEGRDGGIPLTHVCSRPEPARWAPEDGTEMP